jgi:TetR/AcrR family transcriptional regulator, cholesterol catabolism regulator
VVAGARACFNRGPMEERARRIVLAAIELAEKGGFEGVRLRDVAAHADVALGTLYRRFRSKEDLLLAALEHQMGTLEQRIDAQPLAGVAPFDRVQAFFRLTTDGMCARPHLARALVRAVVAGGPGLSQRVAAFHERLEAMIARALRGGASGGPPSERERRVSQALVHVWFASLSGWASGLHGVDAIVADTCSAADLILGGSARRSADGDTVLPPHREHV